MGTQSIEEQLRAIESAINLAQSRHLPAVRQPATLAVTPTLTDERDPAKARDLALVVLKRFNERIASLEGDGAAREQQLAQVAAAQQEHREAIEYIGDEVASLKQRTAEMEAWLRSMHVRDTVHLLQREQSDARNGLRLVWGIAIGLALTMLILGSLLRWG